MPSKTETYRKALRGTRSVATFLRRNSGLPGPRGNLELAHAFAAEALADQIWSFARLMPRQAPENTPDGYLAFCGVLGLGRLAREGDVRAEALLLERASDPRWRVREAVATALQAIGDTDRRLMSRLVQRLAKGGALEKRAAVAAVAEPRLLATPSAVAAGIRILDRATRSLAKAARPLGEDERVLRQALAYAWSVVVAADPSQGKSAMESWMKARDPDLAWIMRQNLAKKRLTAAEPRWCAAWARRLKAGASEA